MASHQYYLTVHPVEDADGEPVPLLHAMISLGHPNYGDEDVTICSCKVVKDEAEAEAWYAQQMIEEPWKRRQ